MFNKIVITFTAFALLFAISCSAMGQNKNARSGVKKSVLDLVAMAREGRSNADPETVRIVKEAYAEEVSREESTSIGNNLTGTWYCEVGESPGGAPPFQAYQTFNADGTFVETSSLLGTGTEGPAHGSWERSLRGFLLTFELFVFDPETGEAVGRVRVRNFIRMNNSHNFVSFNLVDFIEPDGNVIEAIDSGIFTAERVKVRGL
jgi:hypothetical protein